MLRTACSFVFACALAAAVPVAAQDAAPADLAAALVPAVPTAPGAPLAPKVSRPAALVPLYAGFATLQALDYASTMRALANGAGAEANPMMRSIVKNPPAFIALKAAATAGVIVVGEKMWKKNRVGAVLFVAGANAAMAIAVGRNYAVR
ncbi:MAG: hypothetical protein DMF84_09465 [Acidobacteria bacterium]|nr:MAG: hypothetical protein DMF84_09465 [Acidobacteriota bacterium]